MCYFHDISNDNWTCLQEQICEWADTLGVRLVERNGCGWWDLHRNKVGDRKLNIFVGFPGFVWGDLLFSQWEIHHLGNL